MENKLILTSLENAVASLQDALNEYAKEEDTYVRDAVIQRFEYTYELSHKLLKRHLYPSQNKTGTGCLSKSLWSPIRIGSRRDLKSGFHFGTGIEATAANPDEIDTLSFQDLIRLGSERQLLRSGWEKWSLYRKLLGTTSHTYDEAKAQEALKKIPEFYEEAHFLLQQLQAHHG